MLKNHSGMLSGKSLQRYGFFSYLTIPICEDFHSYPLGSFSRRISISLGTAY